MNLFRRRVSRPRTIPALPSKPKSSMTYRPNGSANSPCERLHYLNQDLRQGTQLPNTPTKRTHGPHEFWNSNDDKRRVFRRRVALWLSFSPRDVGCRDHEKVRHRFARSGRPAVRAWFTHDVDCRNSDEVQSVRPPEILCHILRFAVGPDGIKTLLPLTHVSVQWRRAALGDSSLWTAIHLEETTAPLFDMILARAGNQLFTVYVDHYDFGRLAKLWELFDRVEELHYTYDGIKELHLFITSLGPAPNLKGLYLQPGLNTGLVPAVTELPTIFSGCLPSLRTVTLSNTIAWPAGLFKDLVSFDCGASEQHPISAYHALDVLQYSPSIEFLRLVGACKFPEEPNPRAIAFPSLVKCILIGDGTSSLIQFLTLPATAHVSLSKSGVDDETSIFPKFNDCSVVPALCALGLVAAFSLSISDYAVGIRARNSCGGVLDAKVEGLHDLSGDPSTFTRFIRSSIESWRTWPGFFTTEEFTLSIERDRIWGTKEADYFVFDPVTFLFTLPLVEEINLLGVQPRELSLILKFLCSVRPLAGPCSFRPGNGPNLKRLHIESVPLHSPRPLLEELGIRLAERRVAGMPFQSVSVKVKCEKLIPATEHCTFLTIWKSLVTVGEGVKLEYERTEVKRLPKCDRRDSGDKVEDDEDEGPVIDDPGDRCVGWDGWPGKWPRTMEEMRARRGGTTA